MQIANWLIVGAVLFIVGLAVYKKVKIQFAELKRMEDKNAKNTSSKPRSRKERTTTDGQGTGFTSSDNNRKPTDNTTAIGNQTITTQG